MTLRLCLIKSDYRFATVKYLCKVLTHRIGLLTSSFQAPNGSALDLEAGNGPIGIVDFSGQITARNINGPLTFRNVNGQVKADVQNGPLTVAGSGGDFQLNVENGPLTVALDGVQWSGGELEGRAQNGPL